MSWYPPNWHSMEQAKLWSKDNRTYTLFGETLKMPSNKKRPLVCLFDIGGVCVVSPFQAILDYERANGIPEGYINWTISQTNPSGAWQRLERGEMVTDETFYSEWKKDLQNEKRWREYYARDLAKKKGASAAGEAAYQVPPVPDIDTEGLHLRMMTIARELDPDMGPAIKKLREHADKSNGKIIIGALSNTSIFPPSHPLYDRKTMDGKASKALDGIFDVFVSSAHVGMRKPAEDIYKYAIVRLHEFVKTKGYGDGVKPEDIVFLDDIGTNLRTARNLGMRTIRVTLGSVGKAVKELEEVTGLELAGGGKSKL